MSEFIAPLTLYRRTVFYRVARVSTKIARICDVCTLLAHIRTMTLFFLILSTEFIFCCGRALDYRMSPFPVNIGNDFLACNLIDLYLRNGLSHCNICKLILIYLWLCCNNTMHNLYYCSIRMMH